MEEETLEIPSVLQPMEAEAEVLTCQNPTGKRADGFFKKVKWRWMQRDLQVCSQTGSCVVVKEKILEKAGRVCRR